MPATFSINIGQLTESTRKTDIFSVLNDIQDNTQKLISPRDVRDAFLSTWANTPFKVTTPNTLSTSEYIGIDSSNPGNRDIKQRILIGKRSYGGLDIMNSSLLNDPNSGDIFLYNTKPDLASQSSTKVSILAGTNSTLYLNAPYIESKVNNTGTALDLNIVNNSVNGAVNLLSNTGRVAINGIVFPTVAESTGSASNGKILRYHGTYPNGRLRWEEPTITVSDIGIPTTPTNIYGSNVNVNGHSIEFIDSSFVPSKIGDIPQGFSFSSNSYSSPITGTQQNWPVVEVLRKVLYPYVPPVLSLSAINTTTGTKYAEVGTTPSVVLDWSIRTFARNNNEKIIDYRITNTSLSGLSFSGIPGSVVGGTISAPTFSVGTSSRTWRLDVSDAVVGSYTYSITTSIEFINPIFYGFTTSQVRATIPIDDIINSLNKSITPFPGVSQSLSLNYNGKGFMYLVCDSIFGIPKKILDPNGYVVHDINNPNNPTASAFVFNGYTLLPPYNSGTFISYRSKYRTEYPNGEFKFIF